MKYPKIFSTCACGTAKMATSMGDEFKFTLDIHFAQKLAGNFVKIRDRTVKKLKRWIAARSVKQSGESMEAELMRLWKGLFYCMWMCDKPVLQEELADKIADLVHSFATPNGAMMFFDTFLLTMKREWLGIDRLRMDKYFMFIRRCFRQVLVILRNNNWEDSLVDEFLAVLSKTPLNPDPEASPDGLRYHFIDIYREELARCAGKELTASDQVMKLIEPFCVLVTTTHNKTLLKVILRGFFQEIVDESDVGFPDESEDEGIDSGEDNGGEAKERATEEEGKDNMGDDKEELKGKQEKKKQFIPREQLKLQYDYKAIADRLFVLASKDQTPGPVRRKVYAMVKKLRDLSEGVFPDYNVGSLMDYQDDDDDERSYIVRDRPPKKARRRGGKQVKERRLAKASQEPLKAKSYFDQFEDSEEEEHGEDCDEIGEDDKASSEEEKAKKKRRRRKKKKQKKMNEVQEAAGISENDTVDEGLKMNRSDESKSHTAKEGGIVSEPDSPKSATLNETPTRKKTEGNNPKEDCSPLLKGTASKKAKKRKLERGKDGLVTFDTYSETKKIQKEAETPEVGSGEEQSNGSCSGSAKSTEKLNNCSDQCAVKSSDLGESVSPQLNLTMLTDKSRSPQSTPTLPHTAVPKIATADLVPEGGVAKKQRKRGQPFAAFQAVSTPTALAKRRPLRVKEEPQTEPSRKPKSRLVVSEDGDSNSVTPRKQVKIALGLNKTHGCKDYKKQLEKSPGIPFDGSKTPRQSVLKTPSPKTRRSKQKAAAKANCQNQGPTDASKMSWVASRASPQGSATKTPNPKTPSPKIIKEEKGTSGLRTPKSSKSVMRLRRSSRIRSLND